MSTQDQTTPIPDAPIAYVSVGQGATRQRLAATLNADGWDQYFRSQQRAVQATAQRLKRVTLAGKSASIAPTVIPVSAIAPGLYRVTVYFRLTQAATVNSSLTVNIAHTDGTVACQFPGTAFVGNVTNRPQSFSVMLRSDQATSISFEVIYASVGAQPMLFDLELVLEALPA